MRRTTGGDPRDRRQMYLGDDHLNPDMRPSVMRLVNKLNSLPVMEDPENRASIVRKLAIDLPPYETAEVIAVLFNSWKYQMSKLAFYKPSILSSTSFETVFGARLDELTHDFVPTISRMKPGKKVNRCQICGSKKDHFYHTTGSKGSE